MFYNMKSNYLNQINYKVIDKIKKTTFKTSEQRIHKVDINKKYLQANKNNKEIFEQIIVLFLNTMLDNCKYFSLENFNKNYQFTIFKIKHSEEKRGSGGVQTIEKEICGNKYRKHFFNINNFNVATHELMHLSTLQDGFKNIYLDLGNGLNEGYTELLNRRYFNVEYNNPYMIETNISELLEKILGIDFMENIYFNGNLELIINELQKYIELDKINDFIKNVDIINNMNLIMNSRNYLKKRDIAQKHTYLSYNFLFELFIKKYESLDYTNKQYFISKFNQDDFYKTARYYPLKGVYIDIESIDFLDNDDYYNMIVNVLKNDKKIK